MLPEPKKEVLFSPFPKQQEFLDACLSGKYEFVMYGGAIRGGKTYAMLALFILLCKIFPGSRWAIVRKDMPTMERNLFPSWDKIKPTSFIPKNGHNHRTQTVTFKNGSQIIFFPETDDRDKEKNRWKGLEVNGFGFEEINECQKSSLMKGFERAGSYVIKWAEVQPPIIIAATCNPTQGWVKDLVYTPNKLGILQPNWLYIQSRIYDNIPLLEAQPLYLPSLLRNMGKYERMVFVEGDWDVTLKTGGEFLRGFEISLHTRPVNYDLHNLMHVSMDSNVYPHIAITIWQTIRRADGGWILRQVHELPAADPENTASRAGRKVADWLRGIGYNGQVYLYGDRSTKARNNIDENKRSFFQIVDEQIRNARYNTRDMMGFYSPPVATMGDFVNEIFDKHIPTLEIEIGEHCKESISDYIATKTDKDGGILKVRKADYAGGPSYEHNGHLTDTLKDFICQCCAMEYQAYVTRYSGIQPGGVTLVSRISNITP